MPPHPRRTSSPATRLAVLVTTVLTLVAGLVLAPPAAAAPADRGPVVVVGFGGLRWDDVSRTATPALWSMLEHGSVGVDAVRSVRTATCPIDGWLTLSAGRRAAQPAPPKGHESACATPAVDGGPGDGSATVSQWSTWTRTAAADNFDAHPGTLGQALRQGGVCATAFGPGAGIALADRSGRVAAYDATTGPEAGSAAAKTLGRCPLAVVDAGTVRDDHGPRAPQVQAVDKVLAAVLADVPQGTTVLAVGLADSGDTPHLQAVAATGPAYGPGWLRTSSTRQVALVQLTDVAPTVLSLVGAPEAADAVGSPLTSLAAPATAPPTASDRLEKVLDLDRAARTVQPLVSPFFTGLVLAQLVLYGLGALALRRKAWGETGQRGRVLAAVRRVALVFATVPVATYLANTVPWWRTGQPLLTVVAVVAGYVALISLVAQLGPWRRRALGPFGAVAGITAAALATDIVVGSRLQLSSLMGLQPTVAGRFYGFSNVAFALFATGALLLATALADGLVRRERRLAAAVVVAGIGVVATALDVLPRFGSDFGGPLAMVPAFAVLTLFVLGVRLTWLKGLLIAAATVVVVTAVSVVDWLRPADQRTHLGRFVQTVVDGGAWQVIARKAEQNFSILFGNVLSLLVPIGALFVALVLMRPSSWGATALQRAYDRSPTLRHGLVALMLMLAIGFAVNDSGTAIPAVGATLAIPLVLAASIRALERDDAAVDEPAAPAPAGPPPRATA